MSLPWSSKGSKATPVIADELMIIDSEDATPSTTNKRITIGSLPSAALPVADTTSIVEGSVDDTKLLRFEVDGFTTATTRVLTPPDADGIIVLEDFAQTLANKTLTTPIIGDFTNATHDHTNAAGGGTLTAAAISNFDTAVSANSDVTTNTAKVTNANHTGEVTGDTVLTITDDAVTYAKIQNVVADDVLLGNVAGAGGIVTELTGANVNLILPVFTDVLNGLVPLSGGGTTNFLRADGTWAVPAGGGSQTPILQNVDYDNFGITDMDAIGFDGAGTSLGAAVANIFSDAGGLHYNAPVSDTHDFTLNGTSEFEVSATVVDLKNNILQFSDVNTTIQVDVENLQFDVSTLDGFEFRVNNSSIFVISEGFLDIPEDFAFRWEATNDARIAHTANGFIFEVMAGDDFSFEVNSVEEYSFNATEADYKTNDIVNIGDLGMSKTGTARVFTVDRDEVLADDTIIGQELFRAQDGGNVLEPYVRLDGVMESDVVDNEDGSYHIHVAEAGTFNVKYISFNELSSALIDIFKPTNFNSQNVTNAVLITPTITATGFTNMQHTHQAANTGGQLVATLALTATGTKDSTTFLRGDDTWVVPPGGEVFTWSADHSMATFKLTADAGNDVILNAPTGQGVSIEVNSVEEYSFNATTADFLGNNLQNAPQILDSSGNELLIFTTTALAVNEITLVNAATATPVEIQATGDDTDIDVQFTPKGSGTFYGNRETWAWPLTDETTAPTTGVKYTTEPAPYDMSIEDAIGGLTTAGTGVALFTMDVLKETSVNGDAFSSIFTTDLVEIDASEFTSTTAATQPNITTTTWEKGRRLQLSITILDSNTLGRGAKVSLITHATAK